MPIRRIRKPCKTCEKKYEPTGKYDRLCGRCKFKSHRERIKNLNGSYPTTKYKDTAWWRAEQIQKGRDPQ